MENPQELQAAIVRLLKNTISEVLSDEPRTAEEIVDAILEKSEVALQPQYKQELINHLKQLENGRKNLM
jgi:aspartate/tyrosine/aromatic aminotransferase